MKGLQPLFLGIFGIFAFSWFGMTVVPNLQIGSLEPQSDEEGTDIYPLPPSGMVARGAHIYAANGCFYCHSQQVRPDYGGSDLERKWGQRRSAPRDYIFEPVVFLGKMRNGPDLANVGHRPGLQESGAAAPTGSPGAPEASPSAPTAGGGSPAAQGSPAAAGASGSQAASSPAAAASPASAANAGPSPAGAAAAASPSASPLPPAGNQPDVTVPTSAPSMAQNVVTLEGEKPMPYTAAWHHRHLYDPRSIVPASNMPSYRFLYKKRQIRGEAWPDSPNFAGDAGENPEHGWVIVPSYDAKCLVAYLMSRDQSHPLKEAKSPVTTAPAGSPAPAKEAQK
jgi:cbb3-type cytochrome oxidase cytochrome c subunit